MARRFTLPPNREGTTMVVEIGQEGSTIEFRNKRLTTPIVSRCTRDELLTLLETATRDPLCCEIAREEYRPIIAYLQQPTANG